MGRLLLLAALVLAGCGDSAKGAIETTMALFALAIVGAVIAGGVLFVVIAAALVLTQEPPDETTHTWVEGHERRTKRGRRTWVKGHWRRK